MRESIGADRKAEVWRRLETVTDPELDEPVTALEFVTRADVDANNCVHIEFRLPTYWCAANFSFLMADDMRNAVKDLPWVADVSVVLGEHMYADTINAGLARGLSFQETFGAEADGDLDELRRTFLLKAFQRRQAALLAHLIEARRDAAGLVEMTLVTSVCRYGRRPAAGRDVVDLCPQAAACRRQCGIQQRSLPRPVACPL
jgi:metal-sulfur cluster biosynthetic enzyme